ncbi:MAG: transporter substrate-binding domain-containing protein [Pseudomonadota bacterium]
MKLFVQNQGRRKNHFARGSKSSTKSPAMPMTTIRLILGLILSFIIPQPVWAETITLVADEWAPYNIQPGIQPEGYMVDVAREIFKAHNITITYKIIPWKRALEGTKSGEYNAAIGPSRDEAPYLIFPDEALASNQLSFWVKKGNPWRFSGRDSVKEISLGLIQGYDYREWLNTYAQTHKKEKDKVQFVFGKTPMEMNLRKLMAGRVGVVVDSEATIRYTATRLHILDAIEKAGQDNEPSECYIAFSPALPRSAEYARMLSEGIAGLRRSGRLQQILSNYGLQDWKE